MKYNSPIRTALRLAANGSRFRKISAKREKKRRPVNNYLSDTGSRCHTDWSILVLLGDVAAVVHFLLLVRIGSRACCWRARPRRPCLRLPMLGGNQRRRLVVPKPARLSRAAGPSLRYHRRRWSFFRLTLSGGQGRSRARSGVWCL